MTDAKCLLSILWLFNFVYLSLNACISLPPHASRRGGSKRVHREVTKSATCGCCCRHTQMLLPYDLNSSQQETPTCSVLKFHVGLDLLNPRRDCEGTWAWAVRVTKESKAPQNNAKK